MNDLNQLRFTIQGKNRVLIITPNSHMDAPFPSPKGSVNNNKQVWFYQSILIRTTRTFLIFFDGGNY